MNRTVENQGRFLLNEGIKPSTVHGDQDSDGNRRLKVGLVHFRREPRIENAELNSAVGQKAASDSDSDIDDETDVKSDPRNVDR